MLKIVTLTGADDSIQPKLLSEVSDRYPFAEWAILYRGIKAGKPRFPSMQWMMQLKNENAIRKNRGKEPMNLSLHLCGEPVFQILNADDDFIDNDINEIFEMFQRVQINTHGEAHPYTDNFVNVLANFPDVEWIFQYDNVNFEPLKAAVDAQVKFSALFDLSHGAGILPEIWPVPLEGVKCGYAGGIGPDNIEQQIMTIDPIVGEKDWWIDMETKVRSVSNQLFDLRKVERVLHIAAPYLMITPPKELPQ